MSLIPETLDDIPNENEPNEIQSLDGEEEKSVISIAEESTTTATSTINKIYELCNDSKESDDEHWEEIREWLTTQPKNIIEEGVETAGEFNSCALHLVCRNNPPVDIVKLLCTISPHIAEYADLFGWLPLHYACANGADEQVIQVLIEVCPSSMLTADKKGRTPLHFALNLNRPASPFAIELLAATGAAKLADENGMLPIHYGKCAYTIK